MKTRGACVTMETRNSIALYTIRLFSFSTVMKMDLVVYIPNLTLYKLS